MVIVAYSQLDQIMLALTWDQLPVLQHMILEHLHSYLVLDMPHPVCDGTEKEEEE